MAEDKKSVKERVEKASAKATKKKSTKTDGNSKTKELEKQVAELKNDYLRSRADYENFRKRVEKEKLEIRDRAIVDFVLDILPAIDNFEMSLKMSDNQEMFIKGVEMIHKNLMDTLSEHHFEEFSASEGDVFDPDLHDPIPLEDKSGDSSKIVGTVKKGFKHKEKVIRPAKVNVPKHD